MDDEGLARALEFQRRLNQAEDRVGEVQRFFDEREQAGDKVSAMWALIFLNVEIEKKHMPLKQASPLLRLMIILGFVAGVILALFGVWLVYLGSTGETKFRLFGQSFESANVGIAAIFIGAVTIIL